jgi:hypothetical protein
VFEKSSYPARQAPHHQLDHRELQQHFTRLHLALIVIAQAALPGIVNLSSSCEVWHTRRMNTPASDNCYKNPRFPAEIISHGVWLYVQFCLSYRDVEERHCQVTWEAPKKHPLGSYFGRR